MPGDIRAKERAIVTLTSTGAALTQNSAAIANATANLDARAGGNFERDLQVQFELTMQWVAPAPIAAGTVIAELYLVPVLDGTNDPEVNTTAGASTLPYGTFAAQFVSTKLPASNVNMRFVTGNVPINPLLYRPYVKLITSQSATANWTLKAVGVQALYT